MLTVAQDKTLQIFNVNKSMRTYHPGEKVFLRRNKRLGNKLDKVFVEKTMGTTVLIDVYCDCAICSTLINKLHTSTTLHLGCPRTCNLNNGGS
ncbi:unnamed protein product [Ceratitis capitata]|uniref:(Mediterranean fruit fly) hypothetical protein n=1 Tax=Ceratitis capitata TaxID=7213 RepID=A0A811UUK0_CERCA|nr:unnamed protein product [Ceratitis capitata]